MSDFDSLRDDLAKISDSFSSHTVAQYRMNDAFMTQHERLWEAIAAMGDDQHALANRIETLTRAAMADPDDTAVAIVKALRLTKPYDQDAS